ncbi:type II toxin-antitoxin system VapC family toxin [Dyadobacter sp. CY323]|uniref:type II toxin-antitoxin system VapC family toxin n=1 Tax=Dyadobacter sp. CY323 TaxID=2907302 RepID=UPI001F3AED34|nr:type II toxin-antitoxin system VapC family toxin [Dyadobacter sp. CY323]MCE6991530.1 type II toxin-antitoxin system VapC family toxin [Dyadobacter sp. CY323]
MKSYLIDTHILLWHSAGSGKLSGETLEKLNSPETRLLVSTATYWEMTIKKSLGKLDLAVPISDFYYSAVRNSFYTIPIDFKHFQTLENLPLLHADPFDRLIISQAISEDLTIITQDQKFKLYEQWVSIFLN